MFFLFICLSVFHFFIAFPSFLFGFLLPFLPSPPPSPPPPSFSPLYLSLFFGSYGFMSNLPQLACLGLKGLVVVAEKIETGFYRKIGSGFEHVELQVIVLR
jgi:hypothetical protein